MIRRILNPRAWQRLQQFFRRRQRAIPRTPFARASKHVEVLENRIAPAATFTLGVGENSTFAGDALSDTTTVFNFDADFTGFYNSGGLTAVGFAGGDIQVVNGNEVRIRKTVIDGGTITFTGGGGTDDILFNAGLQTFNGLSATDYDTASVGGGGLQALTIGTGGLVLEATGTSNDLTIGGGISVAGGTAEFRSARSIVVSSGSDITTSGGALTVILNADRDANSSGGVFINAGGTTITTGGGDFTIGGGTTPASTPVFGPTDRGIYMSGASISTGAGIISIRGQGDSTSGGGPSTGIDLDVGNSITTTSGNITLVGTGGAVSDGSTMGVNVFSGTSISTATGAISITGTSNATGSNAYGVKVQLNSKVEATGNGSISITGSGGASASGSSNEGVALFDNADVSGAGSGSISVDATAGANSHALNTGSGSNDITIGGASQTGAITISANSMALGNTTIQTTGTATLKQKTNTTAINLGSTGGPTAGTLELSNSELNLVTAGTLQIGDSNSGAITVTAAISRAGGVLSLQSGSTVSQNGGATLTVTGNDLAVRAGGAITLGQSNAVSAFAATTTTGGITYFDGDALTIGTVAGVAGISTAGGSISLTAGGDLAVSNTAAPNDVDAVTGTVTLNAGVSAVNVSSGATVRGTGGVTIAANSADLAGTLNAGTNTVSIAGTTGGRAINLGTATGALDLTNAELNNITAGTIAIGDSGSGLFRVSSAITRTVAANLTLATGGGNDIDFNGGTLDAGGGNVTLTAGSTGQIFTTTGGTHVTAAALLVNAGIGVGALGSAAIPFTFSATSIKVISAGSGSGDHYIAAATPVSVLGFDSQANTTFLRGGTFNLSASNVILNSTKIDVSGTATLAAGAFSDTFGTLTVTNGSVTTTTGKLSPGNVTLNSSSTVGFAINGLTAGTSHGQLDVTGTVDLTGATLSLSGSYIPTASESFIIVANDGADAVTGTFNGLAEGATVSVNGTNKRITYVGGTGNDVALVPLGTLSATLTGGNLTIADADATGKANTLTVKLINSGADLEITDATEQFAGAPASGTLSNGNKTLTIPFSSVTGSITFNTGGLADALTLDLSGGDFINAAGVAFNGGNPTTGTGDSLTITGGTTTSIAHSFSSASDGSITLTGALAGTISYTGLEPVTDNMSATNRSFTFTGGSETITLTDATGANMTIDSTLGESVTFANPTTSLTIDATSGTDAVSINSMDAAYTGSLTITSDGGDTATISSGLPTLTSISVTVASINLNSVTTTGTQSYTGSVTLQSSATLNTTNSSVSISGTIDGAAANTQSLTISAGTSSITLGGVIGGSASLRALTTTSGTIAALPAAAIGSDGLSVTTTAGGISQSGGLTVSGTSSFSTGSFGIFLTTSTNDFTGAVSFTNSGNNNISVTDTNAIVLGTSSIGSGTLTVNAVGITQTGAITQAASASGATFNAGAGVITLTQSNNFTGAVSLNNSGANAVSVTDSNAIALGTSAVGSSTLSVTAVGITQTGAITQAASAGTATFTGGAGVITIDNSGNDFTGSVALSNSGSNAVSIRDANALSLAASTVGQDLTIQTNGALTQTGAVVAPGTTRITATATGDVTLGTTGNNFSTIRFVSANNVTLVETGGFAIGGGDISVVSGNYSVTTTGSITSSNSLRVTGTATFDVGSGNDITHNVGTEQFSTVVVTSGRNVTLRDSAGALDFGASTISGTFSIAGAAGTVTDSGNLVVTGNTSITAGSGNDVVFDSAGNNFSAIRFGSVNNVTLVDTNGIILGFAGAGGDSSISGALSVTAGGSITDGNSVSVTGHATFNAGSNAITLGDGSETTNFASLQFTGGAVSIQEDSAMAIGGTAASVASTSLSLTASGAITQTQALSITGAASFSAGANAITLTDSSNSFGGTVALNNSGANNVALVDSTALSIATSSVGTGTLNLTGAGISQTGAITQAASAGAVTLTGGAGAINLASTNNFTGTVGATTTGAAAGITINDNSGGLTIGTVTTTDGAISLSATSGTLAAATVTAGGTGQNISLTTATSGGITLGNVTASGDTVTINSAGTIEESGADAGADVTANTLTVSAGTSFGASAAIETAVSSFSAATTGAINIANSGALTLGAVSAGTGAITISASSPLTVSANMSTSAAILLTAGEISDATTWADDLTVNSGITVQSTGSTVTLRAGDDVILQSTSSVSGVGVTLTAAFGDLDNHGDLVLNGSVTSTGGFNYSSYGDMTIGSISAAGQNVTLTSTNGAIIDGNAGAMNVVAALLTMNASTGIGVTAPGNALETTISQLAAVTATGGIGVSNTGALQTNDVRVTGASGGITISAASPLTITMDMTAPGAIVLTAGETAGAGDDLTVNAGVTVQSTGSSVTLQAGDDIILTAGAGNSVTAATTATLTANHGNLDLLGGITVNNEVSGTQGVTATARTNIALGADINSTSGDISLTTTNGNITWTAGELDSQAGTGTVNLTATNGAIGASGAKVDMNTSFVNATSGGAGGVFISDNSQLEVTSIVTGGGNVEVTVDANDIVIGSINAGSGDVTLTAIGTGGGVEDDVNDAVADIIGDQVSISTAGGIGELAGSIDVDATEVITSTTTSTNGNIHINTLDGNNSGVLISLVDVQTSGLINLTATSGTGTKTYATVDSNDGAITIHATQGSIVLGNITSDSGVVGTNDITVTAQAGAITVNGTVTSDDLITLTAQGGAVTINGTVTADNDVSITSQTSSVTIAGSIQADDDVTITTTAGTGGSISFTTGSITAGDDISLTANTTIDEATSDATADVTGDAITLSAQTGIGVNSSIDIDVNTVTSATSVTGGIAINLLDSNSSGVSVTTATASTSGTITFTGTTGNGTRTFGTITANGGGISISADDGNIAISGDQTASTSISITSNVTGDITRPAAGAELLAPTISLVSNGVDGDIGTLANRILTAGTTITFTAGGSGDVFINEANGANVSGTSGTGAINLLNDAGNWTINGAISTAGDVTMESTTGDINRSGALSIVSGDELSFTGGGVDGDIGSSANPVLTAGADITFTATASNAAASPDIFITESDGADVRGTTGTGNITLVSTNGDWTIDGAISTTATLADPLRSNVTMTVSAGSIFWSAGTVTGDSLTFTASGTPGHIGASGAPVLTDGDTISFAGGGAGNVFLTENDGATIGGSTGTGNITLVTTAADWTINAISTTGGTVSIDAADSIFDGNAGTTNVTAANAILLSGAGVGTAAAGGEIELDVTRLEGDGSGGGFYVSDAGALTVGGISATNGISSVSGDIVIDTTGALTIEETIETAGDVTLDAGGAISETLGGLIDADLLTTTSTGGLTLNGANTVAEFTADNNTSGNISFINTFTGAEIHAVSNSEGGNITLDNTGDVTVDGVVASGTAGSIPGGDITIISSGLLTVDAAVDSRNGTGGTLTISNNVVITASPVVGAGDITLQGGAGSMHIAADITVAVPLVLTATENIVIEAKVEVTGTNNNLAVTADSDLDGDGGVYLHTDGQLVSPRDLTVTGSEFLGTSFGFGPFADNSVRIDSHGSVAQLLAARNITVQNSTAAPATSAIHLGGRIESTNSHLLVGNITIVSAVELIDDDAAVIIAGAGSVTFDSTIDSTGTFALEVRSTIGNVNFLGIVGGTSEPGDVTVSQAGNVNVNAAFTVETFTATAGLTVTYNGPVTTLAAGLNQLIVADALVTNGPVDGSAGNILWSVDNIAIGDDVSGTGTLTIQPRTDSRTIGINETGDLNLTIAEVAFLQDGFAGIQIGRATASSDITIGAITFLDPVTILAEATGGSIAVNDTLSGTDNASVTLRAPAISFNVDSVGGTVAVIQAEADAVTTVGNVTLTADTLILTELGLAGGDVTMTGWINGAFDFVINAGDTGDVTINGGVNPPGGASVGGGTALSTIEITGATIELHPQIVTTGSQEYNAPDGIETFAGALRSRTSGSITLNGPVSLNQELPIFTSGTAGADIIFTSSVDSLGANGALRLNAGEMGDISFGGSVGSGTALKSLEITEANEVTVDSDLRAATFIKIDANEIDFDGGADTVSTSAAGTITLQTNGPGQAVRVGGAADSGAPVLDLTAGDIAALADGFSAILIARLNGTGTAIVPGITIDPLGVTFGDPVTFRQSVRSGSVDVLGDINMTDGASVTITSSTTSLSADITTDGGGITTDFLYIAAPSVTLTSDGGHINLTNAVYGTGMGGQDLTLEAGAGNITFNGSVGIVGPQLGDIEANSTGITRINSSLKAASFTTDAGGSTELKGNQVTTTDTTLGQNYGDPVVLNSSIRLMSNGGPVQFASTIDSKLGKSYSLTVDAKGGDVDFGGEIGGTQLLGTLRVKTITGGSVTFAASADITAKTVNVSADTFTLQSVSTTSSQNYAGVGTFNGALTGTKLTVTSKGDIDNNGQAWNFTSTVNLKAKKDTGGDEHDISITGAGNKFGQLLLSGRDATVVEDDATHLRTVKLTGDFNLTSGNDGVSAGDVTQGSMVRAVALTIDANNGAITLGGPGNRFSELATISARNDILIVSANTAPILTLTGSIDSSNGGVILVVNNRGSKTNFVNLGGASAITTGAGENYLIYTYSPLLTSLGGLTPTEDGPYRYPTLPAPGDDYVIYAVSA